MGPQTTQSMGGQDPASHQAIQLQMRRQYMIQQQQLQQQQHQQQKQQRQQQQQQPEHARVAATNGGGGGVGPGMPQPNGMVPGTPAPGQAGQAVPPQSGQGAPNVPGGMPNAGAGAAPGMNPNFRPPHNAFNQSQQHAFIQQAVQTLRASGIGNGPPGQNGVATNTIGTPHAPPTVGPVVQH